MRPRMSPIEFLRVLNSSARAGKIDIFQFLEQHFIPEGNLFRRPIRFEPWQRKHILQPVFAKVNGVRQWDSFLIGIPKKNGKSTMGSVIATYALLLDDPNPQVYSAAGDKDQARIIFNFTTNAFKRSPPRSLTAV